jgi:proline iminopeptidase
MYMRLIKKIIFAIILQSVAIAGYGQALYSKDFGRPGNKTLIFLHGGPGYNAATFEETTAQKLADKGFYVIVYDRRGEGRSVDPKATFTFQESFDDLDSICNRYNVHKVNLIGHSFGGIIATLYANRHPGNVQSVIFIAAPVSLQETFRTIRKESKDLYTINHDSVNLHYMQLLEEMDTASFEYSSYSFAHAMQNHFYSPQNPTGEARKIYELFKTDTLLMKYSMKMTSRPAMQFWKNEKYTVLNIDSNVHKLLDQGVHVYAFYGKNDGLYSTKQVDDLGKIIGSKNLKYYVNCSHSVFIDQQTPFIADLTTLLK